MNSPKKILLIDGDHLFGHSIKTSLLPGKYKIISAYSCIAGIQKAFQYDPDLILYNTNLDALDGSEVFKALKLTPSFSHIPIVFYNEKDEVQIKNLINDHHNSTQTGTNHQNRLPLEAKNGKELQRKINQEVSYDFNALFQSSPNGMFIFDKKGILAVNKVLQELLKPGKQEASASRMEDFLDKSSLQMIKQWMKSYFKNGTADFNQQVIFNGRAGECVSMNLRIIELKKAEDSVHFLGTFQGTGETISIQYYQLAQKLTNLLKMENMKVSEELEKKIIQTVKLNTMNESSPKKSFFTRRENEVLRLSMEGLSIKLIADQLSLSTRTVEKYRTKLMLKSGAKNIVEVIVFSIKNNLLKI